MAHPPGQTLERYATGSLAAAESSGVQQHLVECAECRREVARAVAKWAGDTLSPQWSSGPEPTLGMPEEQGASTDVAVGALIGRYVVIGHLGQGAMGQVLAAYDPRLERKVALKLLRSTAPAVGNAALRARLIREARVLAQLTHPNVVHVHDVGDYGDSIFIAMDFVDGTTLTRWLAGGEHPWRAVLDVFLMAGRGLAAAHAANLIHRDFKPDNVLVGRDGVVRVTDFGVARKVKDSSPHPSQSADEDLSGRSSLIGTPAYMAPEQLEGLWADPRSDQFGFCVALFEALYRRRPYAGDTLEQLREAVRAGRIAPFEPGVVPRWLQAAVAKGLSVRAEDRFESMAALLAALEQGRQRRPATALAIVAVVLSVVAAAALTARELNRRKNDPCVQAEARVSAVWNAEKKPRLRAAFEATALPYAGDAVTAVVHQLDAWGQQWPASYARACADGRSENAHATAGALARQACLERQLLQVGALVEILEKPTPAAAQRAADAVERQLEGGCAATTTLPTEPEDPKARLAVRKVRADLAREGVLHATGFKPESPTSLAELAAAAKALGLFPEQAWALRLQGMRVREAGKLVEAERLLSESARVAEAGRADEEAVQSREALAWTVAIEEGDLIRGRNLLEDARAALDRAGRPDSLVQAVMTLEASLTLREGRLTESLELAKKLVELRTRLSGPDSLAVAEALGVLSVAERMKQLFDDSLAHNARSLELLRGTLGSEHPVVALALTGRAAIYAAKRDHASALPFAEQAVAIMEKAPGEQVGALQIATYNLGLLYRRLQRFPEAVTQIHKALALIEQSGSPNAATPEFLSGLAETYEEMKKYDLALEAASRAIALREKAAGAEAKSLTTLLSVRGGIYVDLDRQAEAAVDLERALNLMSGPDANPALREVTRYDLARSLWFAPATRPRAMKMMGEIRAYFVAAGPNYADYVKEIDDWLKTHPK